MAADRKQVFIAAGVCAAALALAPTPASAGFFDQLFGGLRHAFSYHSEPPRHADSYAEPSRGEPRHNERVVSRDSGPARGFCVRTCDGHYFPVQAQPGMSAADACHSFCPASETRVYSGRDIDYATTGDGSRYSDLPNAFRYRKELVSGCTCNGRSAFGLANVDATNDPTLRPGDVVATKTGLMMANGVHGKTADLTPVDATRLPPSEREALSEVRVTTRVSRPRAETTGAAIKSEQPRPSAQLAK